MGFTENGVIDFLADAIKYSNIIVIVFSASMALDGFIAFGTFYIQLLQEMRLHHIIRIQNNDIIKIFRPLTSDFRLLKVIHGVLHGFGLDAFIKNGQK